ncbi:MAG: DUF4038 domain-containing protein [Chthonomonadales bacterium]|nr:DUF4038 domain-containing protein [Chthonomonadales bacterium]
MIAVPANTVAELAFHAQQDHADPFNTVRLDVLFETPGGGLLRVPAFWAGGATWKVRYASAETGRHAFSTVCSAKDDAGLHGVSGEVEIRPYEGANPLYARGPIRPSDNHRYLQHADGTPFFWLGDTWWMGLCKRIRWPDEFQVLTDNRLRKGFNVVQIVAGLYPDMGAFDPRGANEAGFPWEEEWASIRPAHFDHADARIAHLVESGIVPCIVGAWGYYLPWLGPEKMKRHWRYLIARWGAYPVAWCVAGEANLPWYLVPNFPYDDREAVTGWTEIAAYVRATDPFGRPVSIHPTGLGRLSARGSIDDQGLLDFDMLQTGHGDRESLGPTVDTVRWSYGAEPRMPVLNSEVNYEGILGRCHDDVQRLMFWTCILNGACGHTYGANGIWQMNQADTPYGNSPHGGTYGPTPWQEAMNLPGSRQLGEAKRLLDGYAWHEFEPHPEWAHYVDSAAPRDTWHHPHAAGIRDRVRFIYAPQGFDVVLCELSGDGWRVRAVEPASGAVADLGQLQVSPSGSVAVSRPFSDDASRPEQDWLIIAERT